LCYSNLRLANFTEPHYSIAKGIVICGYGLSLFLVFFHFPTRTRVPQARAQGLLQQRSDSQTGEQVMVGGEEVMACASKLSDQNTWQSHCTVARHCHGQTTVLTLCYRPKLMKPNVHICSSQQRSQFTVVPQAMSAPQQHSHPRSLQSRFFLLIAHSQVS